MMTKKILQLLFLLIGCATQGCISDEEPQGTALQPGDSLPDFSVTLSNGVAVSTQSLKDKVPVIIFFNTSCADCREELPRVEEAWQQWQQVENVVFMAISREEDEQSVAAYWKENNLTIPYSAQSGREIYSLFATGVIPRIFIADPQGKIIFASSDTDMPDADTISDVIREVAPGHYGYHPG